MTNYSAWGALFAPTDQQVWEKGHPIPDDDPNLWRRDDYGNVIKRTNYGKRDSEYGWERDHVVPSALNGADSIHNLRPLHHRLNSSLGGILGRMLSK
jgi:hypothetical protein